MKLFKKLLILIISITMFNPGIINADNSANDYEWDYDSETTNTYTSDNNISDIEYTQDQYDNLMEDYDNISEVYSNNLTSENIDLLKTTGIKKVEANDDAIELESIVDTLEEEKLIKNLNRLIARTQIENDTLTSLLSAADNFRINGGLKDSDELVDTLKNDNSLSQYASKLNLIESAEDAISISNLNSSTKASSYIYVVDKDAVCFVVSDENDEGIENALVTISYLNDNGERITKAARTSGGNVKGVAAFDEIDGSYFATVDIEAEGYYSKTIFSCMITGGEKTTLSLEKNSDDKFYVRGADLDGKDLINSDTGIYLLDEGTENVDVSILITSKINQAPTSVTLKSSNRKTEIAVFSNPIYYSTSDNGETTYLYTLNEDWIKKNNLLKENDELELCFDNYTYEFKGIKVENALQNPCALETELPLNTDVSMSQEEAAKNSDVKDLLDNIGNLGLLNSTFKIGNFSVMFGGTPNGSFFIMGTADITKFKDQFQTLFPKTWSPGNEDALNKQLEPFTEAFWKNAELVEEGKAKVIGTNVKAYSNAYGSYDTTFSILLKGTVDKETGKKTGIFSFIFALDTKIGYNEYFVFNVGPIVIPTFAGIETGGIAKVTGKLQTSWEGNFENFEIGSDGLFTIRVDLIAFLTLYVGIGLRGILSGEIDGTAQIDTGLIFKPFADTGTNKFHAIVDTKYSLEWKVNLLFAKFGGELLSTGWIRLTGTDPDDPKLASTIENTTSTKLTTSASNENATLIESANGINKYQYNDNKVNLLNSYSSDDSSSYLIDSDTYSDSQIQLVSTNRVYALFKIINEGNKTYLAFEEASETGEFNTNIFYTIDMPNNLDVVEYKVVGNEHYAYIGAICADNSKEGKELTDTMCVATLVIDMSTKYALNKQIVSYGNGKYLYNPMPAGTGDKVIVGFKRCDFDTQANGNSYFLSALNYTNSQNVMVIKNEDNYEEYLMGSGEFHCTGVIDGNTPVYWGEIYSDDKCITFQGRNQYGKITDDNGTRIRVTLYTDGYTKTNESEPFISNWTYLDGTNYIVACGKFYYLSTINKDGSYGYEFIAANNSDGLVNSGATYILTKNPNVSDNGLMYLVGLKKNIEIDPNTQEVKNAGTNVEIHTISIEDSYTYGKIVSMHGPMTFNIDINDIDSFTCAYRNDENNHGINLVFTKENDDELTSTMYGWIQHDKSGMIINEANLNSIAVATSDEVISMTITYQNIGYSIENYVSFNIESVDEQTGNKEILQQVKYDYGTKSWVDIPSYYDDVSLYTGDSYTKTVYFRTSKNWNPNKQYRIDVSITSDPYTEDEIYGVSANESINIGDSYLELRGKLSLVNGKHIGELSIENESYYAIDEPNIMICAIYDDCDEKSSLSDENTLLTSFSSNIPKLSNSTNLVNKQAQTYNLSVDLEEIFANNKEDVKGVKIYLIDKNGNQIDNCVVTFDNPYYVHPIQIITPDTSLK